MNSATGENSENISHRRLLYVLLGSLVVGGGFAAGMQLRDQGGQQGTPAGATPNGNGTGSAGGPSTAPNAGKPTDNGNDKKTFTITGSVAGLYPAVTGRTLTLALANNDKFDIRVTSLTVSAANAATGCNRTNVVFGSGTSAAGGQQTFTPNVVVPGNGSATYLVPVTMAATAPNSCSSSTFVLTYSGVAEKA